MTINPTVQKNTVYTYEGLLKLVNDVQEHSDHLVIEGARREREHAELGLAVIAISREALDFNLKFFLLGEPLMKTKEEKDRLAANLAEVKKRQALIDKSEQYFKAILASTPDIR